MFAWGASDFVVTGVGCTCDVVQDVSAIKIIKKFVRFMLAYSLLSEQWSLF